MQSPMEPSSLRKYLEALHISQSGFSKFIDVNDRTVRQWLSGRARIPGPVALMVRYMLAKNISPQDVIAAVYASQPEQDPAPARVSP